MTISMYGLYAVLKNRGSLITGKGLDENSVLEKTNQYIEKFNKYGTHETIEKASSLALELWNIVDKPEFNNFEKVQLLDLAPVSADEAFSLIPSLRTK